jgi:hypothetical protein
VPYADLTDPQTLNLYSYVRNNPPRYTDPNGHCLWDLCLAEGAATVALYAGASIVAAGAIYYAEKTGEAIGNYINESRAVQGRDAQGKFLPKNPGETQPGAEAEAKGLQAVGASRSNDRLTYVDPKTGEKTLTIPDGKTKDGQYVEVKSGKNLSRTDQLAAMGAAAKDATGRPLIVVVQPGTKLSKPLSQDKNIKVVEKSCNQ